MTAFAADSQSPHSRHQSDRNRTRAPRRPPQVSEPMRPGRDGSANRRTDTTLVTERSCRPFGRVTNLVTGAAVPGAEAVTKMQKLVTSGIYCRQIPSPSPTAMKIKFFEDKFGVVETTLPTQRAYRDLNSMTAQELAALFVDLISLPQDALRPCEAKNLALHIWNLATPRYGPKFPALVAKTFGSLL